MSVNKNINVGINGKELEEQFELLLKNAHIDYKRHASIDIEDGVKLQADFLVRDFCIEITQQNSNEHIQLLGFRGNKFNKEDLIPIVILPFENIKKRGFKILVSNYSYIFDTKDMNFIIDFINGFYQDKNIDDELYIKKLNKKYLTYLETFREINHNILEAIQLYRIQIEENTQKSDIAPQKVDDLIKTIGKENYSVNSSEILYLILRGIFKDTFLVEKAKELLLLIRKEGFIDSSTETYKKLNISYSQYYDNLIKKLKNKGLIRKEGKAFILDSKFSLEKIKEASNWIDFAGIRRNQPKELAKIILSLFGLEDLIH